MEDFYEALGVLPSAEDIVITAAYRVLAQRYHPDRWAGSPAEAHERMAAINRAYETLRDPARRSAYDEQRSKNAQASYEQQQDQDREEVFEQAINELEARWKIAADIFPDLNTLRTKLSKLSSALAFSYVTVLLDRKAFNDRQALADRMQDMFLERYFGTDPKIKEVAKDLIGLGARDAAKMLNELVDVLGSEVPSENLIERVFSVHGAATPALQTRITESRRIARFRSHFANVPCVNNLRDLCEAVGLTLREKSNGLFKSPTYEIVGTRGEVPLQFRSDEELIAWGMKKFK